MKVSVRTGRFNRGQRLGELGAGVSRPACMASFVRLAPPTALALGAMLLPMISASAQTLTFGTPGAPGTCCHDHNGHDGGAGQALSVQQQGLSISAPGAVGLLINTNGGPGGDGEDASSSYNHWGGNGGLAGSISFGLSGSTISSASSAVSATAIGGDGGAWASGGDWGNGGNGANIDLAISGSNLTASQYGVIANSGGGSGKPNASRSHAGLGGDKDPGNGADAGAVNITVNNGSVINVGSGSYGAGVAALAGGGAGGNGDYDDGTFGHNHSGRGGAAGPVSVTIDGSTITTSGAFVHGVMAQAIGGNAGQPGRDGQGAQSVEASGGGGAGLVQIENSSAISTSGTGAMAIMAQGIGGNGGNGGSSRGGSGYSGGSGGTPEGVSITNSGVLTTTGDYAYGITASVLGGAGGAGGDGAIFGGGGKGGAGSSLTGTDGIVINHSGAITTSGLGAFGMLGVAVGGQGGASGGSPGALIIGATGGGGGDGGDISIANSGTVATGKDHATGILMHSIGGGGGIGGDSDSTSVITSVAVGGSGGNGGAGGQFNVGITGGAITTLGGNAAGLQLQSIGGGGGHGGFASATSIGVGINVGVAIGGSGGNGGGAGLVGLDIAQGARITTAGPLSSGVRVQSIGGGGGSGGFANSDLITIAPDLGEEESGTASGSFTQGGAGGDGGDGGAINIQTAGAITTAGAYSHGFEVHSIGGGGGSGGAAGAPLRAGTIGDSSLDINVAIVSGGSGGKGGDGAAVTIANQAGGAIATSGSGASALLAQSIGGGGGNGGVAQFENSASFSQTPYAPDDAIVLLKQVAEWLENPPTKPELGAITLGVSVAIGGSGGSGGAGGAVSATNAGALSTTGDHAPALVAQSIGGGGGSGGITESTGLSTTLSNIDTIVDAIENAGFNLTSVVPTLNPVVTIGGSGGANGAGGSVNVANSGSISTAGEASPAILAQSIGGGGGTGMATAQSLAALVAALPDGSSDVVQEITDVINLLGTKFFSAGNAVNINVGGHGSAHGDGGGVLVDVSAGASLVTTAGDNSPAILAQSIGGGGGFAVGLQEYLVASAPGSASTQKIVVGGNGASNGAGGDITVNTGGAIRTGGANAAGVIAQSVSGGGGFAHSSLVRSDGIAVPHEVDVMLQLGTGPAVDGSQGVQSGAAGNILISSTGGQITTSGALSHGVVAQSIAGGGGIGSFSADAGVTIGNPKFLLGSSAQLDGDAGTVTVNFGGQITTGGAAAFGVMAQSIGGGGGYAAIVQGDLPLATWSTFAPGGSGGATSNGGPASVTLASGGAIATSGRNAIGVLAQSIGAGGGVAALTTAPGVISMTGNALSSPAIGSGGAVGVAIEGQITTTGDGAAGVLAQSIGGGGGLVGDLASLAYGPAMVIDSQFSGSQGDGGAVTVNVNGQITTSGANAPAVFAMSAGSGAVVSDAGILVMRPYTPQGNVGGAVTVNVGAGGSITASGPTTPAIYVLSIGNSGPYNGGVYTGGAIAIAVAQGGTVTGSMGTGGTAITAWTPGATAINNYGVINGSIQIVGPATQGNGVGVFTNFSGGVFNAGQVINLGLNGGGQFVNSGQINPGGPGNAVTSNLTGSFTQIPLGQLAVDLDFANNRSDLLAVSGDAMVSGTVLPQTVNPLPNIVLPIVQSATYLGTGAPLSVATTSPVYSYTLSNPQLNTLLISMNADFTPPNIALNANKMQVAGHLQSLWDAGHAPAAPLFGAFLRSTRETYPHHLGSLANDVSHGRLALAGRQSLAFFDRMMSCPVFIDGGTRLGESDCAWGRVIGEWTTRNATTESSGFTARQVTWQVGAQKEITKDWFLGGSLAYGSSRTNTAMNTLSSSADSVNAGLVLKRQIGAWQLSAAVRGGHESWDMMRNAFLPGLASQARSSPKAWQAGARLRASYQFSFESWYLKPIVDLDVNHVNQIGYRENGAGLLNLAVLGGAQTSTMGTGSLEIGGRINFSGHTLRPYATAGISFMSNDDWQSQVRFASFPESFAPFTLTTRVPRAYGNLSAGLELWSEHGVELRAEYALRGAKDYIDQSAALRLGVRF